jgi:hypothetical protein
MIMTLIPTPAFTLTMTFSMTMISVWQLDGPQAGKDLSGEKEEEDKDFYHAAADLPLYLLAPFTNVLTPTRSLQGQSLYKDIVHIY